MTTPSLVYQSLSFAIQEELRNYYKLISLFEQEQASFKSLNLRKLLVWCESPLEKMKWLAVIS